MRHGVISSEESAAQCEAFKESVNRNLDGLHGVSIVGEEFYFSWSQCDSCGTTFGGERIDAAALRDDNGEIVELEVCTDCAMLHANGELPQEWRQHPAR